MKKLFLVLTILTTALPAYAGGYADAKILDGGVNPLNGKPITVEEAHRLEVRNDMGKKVDDLNDFYETERLWIEDPNNYDIEGRLVAAERRTGMERHRPEQNNGDSGIAVVAELPFVGNTKDSKDVPEPGIVLGLLVVSALGLIKLR